MIRCCKCHKSEILLSGFLHEEIEALDRCLSKAVSKLIKRKIFIPETQILRLIFQTQRMPT